MYSARLYYREKPIMTTLYPLCFHPSLLPSEERQRECGDGIYVSNACFRRFMDTDDEQLVIIEISNGTRSVCAHICGVHDSDDSVFAPFWMCELLGQGVGEISVELTCVHPSIGNRIRIQPYTSEYAKLDDPVSALRNGFENYACISSGLDIPLLINGDRLIVSIIDTHNTGPICIRGLELEVEIEKPLDSLIEDDVETIVLPEPKRARYAEGGGANTIVNAAVPTSFAAVADDDFGDSMFPAAMLPDAVTPSSNTNRFPGRGRRLDGKDC